MTRKSHAALRRSEQKGGDAHGIENHPDKVKDDPAIAEDLEKSMLESKKFLACETLSQCPVVAVWRDAFKRFRTKKGARSSIEALPKRVEKGKRLGRINPLVDIYNAVSLTWGFPVGGENIDAFQGDLRLDVSAGAPLFWPLATREKVQRHLGGTYRIAIADRRNSFVSPSRTHKTLGDCRRS